MMLLPKIEATDPLKSEDGNGSIDTLLRQTIGKEPYLSFSRANDSSVQLNQILHAMNQPAYLSGWPLHLLSPMKIQMQKCDKCSREFCSTISYRRHLRLHRRKLNLDKDLATKNRALLQAFWDKLSVEETMEIMSIDDVPLEGISGSSIVKALTSLIRKPGYISLPQSYVKSGSVLLDLVQGRPPRFPISSQELFDILDDASENTFLCAGTAESLQKYVFDGDAGKIGLEMRNLVACTGFLVEQKLVKACLADKDAEALRYQKLLMDEEDAAQKRQAALMEKKRRKKLKQKEQRVKELANAEMNDSLEESISSPPSSSPTDDYDSTLELLVISPDATSSPENSHPSNVEGDIVEDNENKHPDVGAHQKLYTDLSAHQNSDHRRLHRDGQRQVASSRWQPPKLHRNPNGFHTSHNYHAPKPGASQKQASSRNSHTAGNVTKVWTVKPKSESDDGSSKPGVPIEEPKLPCQETKLLIGSIAVSLSGISDKCALEFSAPGNNGTCESPVKGDENQGSANSSALWRPIGRHGNESELPIQNSIGASYAGNVFCSDSDVVQPTCVVESTSNGCEDKSDAYVKEGGHQGSVKFSSHLAEAFLSQRWKEAVTADHVELVLFPEEGSPEHSIAQNDSNQETALSPKLNGSSILHSTKNHLPVSPTIDSSATVKSKARAKAKNGSKVKYIQKQKSGL